jgi:hypothetical protein
MAKATVRTTSKSPRRHLTLSAAQIEAIEEWAVLTACSNGFCYTPAIERACAAIARQVGPEARLAYLALAAQREQIDLAAA